MFATIFQNDRVFFRNRRVRRIHFTQNKTIIHLAWGDVGYKGK